MYRPDSPSRMTGRTTGVVGAGLVAQREDAAVVVSTHDFESTPPRGVLREHLAEATGARVHGEILACEVNFPTGHDQWISYIPPDEDLASTLMSADVLVFVLAGDGTADDVPPGVAAGLLCRQANGFEPLEDLGHRRLVGRPSAGSQSTNDIRWLHRLPLNRINPVLLVILGSLLRYKHGVFSAGNQSLYLFRIGTKCRRTFGRIQYSQSSACSGSCIY